MMDRLITSLTTVLLVVDVQERLAPAMPPARLESLVRSVSILLDAAEALGVRVLASEQYPKGLGAHASAARTKAPRPRRRANVQGDLRCVW